MSLILISGPCAIESREVCLLVAETVRSICTKHDIQYIFKSSFKKANRTKIDSFTGIDENEAIEILKEVKLKFKIPVLTDVHETSDVEKVKDVADYLQIPAFLCRQTDLLLAAGRTGKYVNIKKGQFASPESMGYAVEKIRSTGNNRILLTERGTSFGYHDLVVDFRSVPKMKKFDVPVIVDCTHSLQQPNQPKGVTGGEPEFIAMMCRVAIAAGADGLFIETHPEPKTALSDGENMLKLDKLNEILSSCVKIKRSL